jgi:glycosyltransferase involved in cell wall biosynthesis
MGMKFSVCVINWNYLEVLQPCIQNLRRERETVDLEIIVVDNGSVDGSAEWLAQQDDLITILNKENLGSSVGRNQMIKIAQGDYILMIDSDIIYINGSLEYFASRFSELDNNAKCIGFNPNHFTNVLKDYVAELPDLKQPLKKHHTSFASYALTQYGLFKRDMFEECMFDENYAAGYGCEDDDLYFQMQVLGWDVYQLDCKYYHAKQTDKWNKNHVLTEVNYYDRASYFRTKWNWGG